MTILNLLDNMKRNFEKNGLKAKYLYLSNIAHDQLVRELNRRDGKKHTNVFEVFGMRVIIDPHCPPQGAYISAEKME
jgi:hypothetical protein